MGSATNSAESIFIEAIDIASSSDRAEYLNQACGGDPALLRDVNRLVNDHFQAGSFLGQPAARIDPTLYQPVVEHAGSVIGPYKLLEQIGEGGMGVVFMAEQFRPLQRKVALKIVKPGMDTKQVVARFEAERQALALMDHPNIARVLDAGATQTGRPYFVMELVRGVPINEYCDEHRLSIRERLELFSAICHAVQHAHQKGIIHRDLKPSNILVTHHDGKPLVKVIDFGVAKATGQKLTDKTLFTGFAQLVGTPLYMSPEQAEMSEPDVDTRSDIYSLGVLLYELLTGHTPFDSQRFKAAAFDELRRIIREEEPPRPSTRLSTLAQQTISTVSQQRSIDPRQLSKLFQGELDWIVMKSLEKDRNRRYETASAMAADVERYLHDEPVQACPPSAVYRFRKFARRNRNTILAGSLLALMLLVVVGAIAASIGWVSHDRASRETVLERQIDEAIKESQSFYQSGKLTEADSSIKRAEGLLASGGNEMAQRVGQWQSELDTARRLENIRLDEALPAIARKRPSDRSDKTDEEATIETDFEFDLGTANDAYRREFKNYGIDLDSTDLEAAAERIRRSPIKVQLVAALDDWFQAMPVDKADESSLQRKTKKLEIARLADPDAWRDQLRAAIVRNDQAEVQRLANDEKIMEQPVATVILLARTLREINGDQASIEGAKILRQVQHLHPGDFWVNFELANCLPDEADDLSFRRIAVALRPDSVGALMALGERVITKSEEAEQVYRDVLRLNPDNRSARRALAIALFNQKKESEAISTLKQVIEQSPEDHYSYLLLGDLLRLQHKYAESIAAYQEAIRLQPTDSVAHFDFGIALWDANKHPEAEAEWREAIRIDPKFWEAHDRLGGALNARKKYPEAEAEFREAIRLKPDSSGLYNRLSASLGMQGRMAEAVESGREAIRLNPKDPGVYQALADHLSKDGKNVEAEAAYRDALRLDPRHALSRNGLAALLLGQKRFAEAEGLFRELIHRNPTDSYFDRTLGEILSQDGKYSESEAAFREAFRVNPKDSAAHQELARALIDHAKAAGETPPWDDAAEEFVKAIDLLEDKYHTGRADLCRIVLSWNEVSTRVAALRPADSGLVIGRAEYLSRRSNWTEAAAEFAKVIHDRPIEGDETSEYAYLLLLLGDKEGYQNYCRELDERCSEPKNAAEAFQLVRAYSAGPYDGIDGPRLIELARQAAKGKNDAWYTHAWGLAEYRAGRYDLAVKTLPKSNDLYWPAGAKAQNWFVLAMANYRLHDIDEARKCLETGRSVVEEAAPKTPGGPAAAYVPDWIPIQVLSREVESLLNNGEPGELRQNEQPKIDNKHPAKTLDP